LKVKVCLDGLSYGCCLWPEDKGSWHILCGMCMQNIWILGIYFGDQLKD